MDLEKYIHVLAKQRAMEPTNIQNPMISRHVRSGCVMPVIRKKNIQDNCLTTVEGLGRGLIHENILDDPKKECQCKGEIVGKTIQLEGDRKWRVTNFLVREGLARPELIKG